MDPAMVPTMIFTIIVLVILGGFIVLFPLTRRLGNFLEHRMLTEDKQNRSADVEALARAVDTLRDEVERLSDRQDFTEKLLDRPRGPEA